MNRKGFTLLELLVSIVIASMLVLISTSFLKIQLAVTKKTTKAANSALIVHDKLMKIKREFGVLNHCDADKSCDGTPLQCLSTGFLDRTITCDENKPCIFDNGQWKRKNGGLWTVCGFGVIVKYTITLK
jgi:prepilin-type N-terminal cleavage/methylation domain-containing protein